MAPQNSSHVSTTRTLSATVTDGGTPTVGGILLAAGEGTRFEDGNKLLSEIDSEPIVVRSARALCDADLEEVVVVVGHDAEAIREALAEFDVTFQHNDEYENGQSTSVSAGLEIARENEWDAAIFGLGDMPFVRPSSVEQVREAYVNDSGSIVAPTYKQKRGNPVLFGRRHFDPLEEIEGDTGGRRLIEETEDTALVETDDPGVTRDVDYEEDVEKYT